MRFEGPILTLECNESSYAIDIGAVQEILDVRPIKPLPNTPAYLLGMIDLRGINVPVADLRLLLGGSAAADQPSTRILVTSVRSDGINHIIGLRCDRVIEVTQIDEGTLASIDSADLLHWSDAGMAGMARVKSTPVALIDLDRLFAALGNSPLAVAG